MASVFEADENEKSIIEIIKDSLDVDGTGTVRFKSRTGRGCGKAMEIPGEQFDEFVDLMMKTKEIRKSLVEKQNDANKVCTTAEDKETISLEDADSVLNSLITKQS